MSTAQTVKTQIQSLITKANETTGNSDTTLTNAVNSLIDGFGTGGESCESPSEFIYFCDYDGTVIETWSLEQLQAASQLPQNPTHDGLISQGWNFSLEELKAVTSATTVGQMYTTSDGKTRLYVNMHESANLNMIIALGTPASGCTVTIDWGDNSTKTTATSFGTYKHLYANTGKYVITVSGTGEFKLGYTGSSTMSGVGGGNGPYLNYLYKAEIGDNIKDLSYMAKSNYGLQMITIPNGVTSIGAYAFEGCGLRTITIPNSVTSIGSRAFYNCNSLRSVTIPNSVTSIDTYAFNYCSVLRSVNIPNSGTSIGNYAFGSCYNLQSVVISNSITSIGTNAFYNCYGLETVTIPNSVTSIGDYEFYYCYGLETVTIPNSVTSIGNYAFYRCGASIIDFTASTSIPSLGGSSVFDYMNLAVRILVPSALYDEWISTEYWTEYASFIEPA